MKNGLNCSFWHDFWALNVPLQIAYEDLFMFKIVRDPDSVVADHWDEGEWVADFESWQKFKDELSRGLEKKECSLLNLYIAS